MGGRAIFRPLTVVHKVDLGLKGVLSELNCLLAKASCTRDCFPICLMGGAPALLSYLLLSFACPCSM